MDLQLENRTVLVTGSSGGIGSQIARQFAEEQARLIVHSHRNRQAADRLVDQIGHDRALAVSGDLCDENAVAGVFGKARDRFPAIDILVACAGIWPAGHVPVSGMSLEQWNRTLATNLTATFLVCREFLRGLSPRTRDPSIVLVGSTAGLFGEAGHADYAASKSGLTAGLMLSLKNEMARLVERGRINAVAPGWTVTPMTESFAGDPGSIRKALATVPLRKLARAEDVAHAVLFLSSPAVSGHITGQTLTVSGGMEGRLLNQADELDPGAALSGDTGPV